MLLNYTNFPRAQFSVQRYCFFLIPQNIFEKKVKKTENQLKTVEQQGESS